MPHARNSSTLDFYRDAITRRDYSAIADFEFSIGMTDGWGMIIQYLTLDLTPDSSIAPKVFSESKYSLPDRAFPFPKRAVRRDLLGDDFVELPALGQPEVYPPPSEFGKSNEEGAEIVDET